MDREPQPRARAADFGSDQDLVDWDKAIILETRGRISGRRRLVTIGFLEEPDRTLLVSAAGEDTHWARNLVADSRCRVGRDGGWHDHTAEQLDLGAHREVVAALVLRYGTPAERLGSGPSFRLVPTTRETRNAPPFEAPSA